MNDLTVICAACEGSPKPPNVPCALCGRSTPDPIPHARESASEVLRAAIKSYLDGNYDSPRSHRPMPCKHGQEYYQPCEACIDEHFQLALQAAALADPTPAPSGDDVAELRARVKMLEKRIHNQRAALRRDWQIQERRHPQSRIRLDAVRRAIAARHAAEARCKAMEEALRPFAEACEDVDETTIDRRDLWESPAAMSITAGDLRRARAALSQYQKGEGHGE